LLIFVAYCHAPSLYGLSFGRSPCSDLFAPILADSYPNGLAHLADFDRTPLARNINYSFRHLRRYPMLALLTNAKSQSTYFSG
jgi:hypothetical protein